jgi:hypothetical protein
MCVKGHARISLCLFVFHFVVVVGETCFGEALMERRAMGAYSHLEY